MEKTIEQTTMPTQILHFSVDIEMSTQAKFNQQSIQQAIKLFLQKYPQAFSENSPEKILHNLGFKNEATQLDSPVEAKNFMHKNCLPQHQSDTSFPNEWEQMLQRLKQPPMTLEERKKFDRARQEFRENFIMRDIID
jgi:hypothetical protein